MRRNHPKAPTMPSVSRDQKQLSSPPGTTWLQGMMHPDAVEVLLKFGVSFSLKSDKVRSLFWTSRRVTKVPRVPSRWGSKQPLKLRTVAKLCRFY